MNNFQMFLRGAICGAVVMLALVFVTFGRYSIVAVGHDTLTRVDRLTGKVESFYGGSWHVASK